MISVELDEKGNPKSTISVDGMVGVMLEALVDECATESDKTGLSPAMHELAIQAYRMGWAQCGAKYRKRYEGRFDSSRVIGMTEHGDKVFAATEPRSEEQKLEDGMLLKLRWMRDTVGVDIERMFARALKEKDGREVVVTRTTEGADTDAVLFVDRAQAFSPTPGAGKQCKTEGCVKREPRCTDCGSRNIDVVIHCRDCDDRVQKKDASITTGQSNELDNEGQR